MTATSRKIVQQDEKTVLSRFAYDVSIGLNSDPKSLPSKYMYDMLGSEIYEKIMELPEYYLVKSEYNVIENAKTRLGDILRDHPFNLIELGAGNAYKTKILLKHFTEIDLDFTYAPIDISEGAMNQLIKSLENEIPELAVKGLVAEYFDGLEEINRVSDPNTLNFVLFLGSNVGNLSFEQTTSFISTLHRNLKKDDLLMIGFDLRKDIPVMINAYNDSQGVTADFNLNVLRRINRELGGNFNLEKFVHYEPYNVHTGAMESYLISKEDQSVYIEQINKTYHFKNWEPLFMEHSYKYTIEDVKNISLMTEFQIMEMFYDDNKYFLDSLWKA